MVDHTVRWHPLKHENVTLYLEYGKFRDFDITALSVEGDGTLYLMNPDSPQPDWTETWERKPLLKFASDEICALARRQLEQYAQEHIKEDVYSLRGRPAYWKFHANLFSAAGDFPTPASWFDKNFDRIIDGIVAFLSPTVGLCAYDFVSKQVLGVFSSRWERLDCSVMNAIYHQSHAQALAIAYQQYLDGTAPAVYEEIIKLNAFLKDKKSLKLVMQNGESYTLKADRITTGYLLEIVRSKGKYPKVVLNPCLNTKPAFPCGSTDLSELSHLLYGKQEFPIRADLLAFFERPATKM